MFQITMTAVAAKVNVGAAIRGRGRSHCAGSPPLLSAAATLIRRLLGPMEGIPGHFFERKHFHHG